MDTSKGYIYILTNPSFPEYVKIGYATDVENRVKDLNNSSAIPFGFRIYAKYKVQTPLSDKEAHKIIDTLNGELRSTETLDGKLRRREFFKLTAEEAYTFFEAMATIHGCTDALIKYNPTAAEQEEEKEAEQIRKKKSPFSFVKAKIAKGERLECPDIDVDGIITVYDSRRILYKGEIMYMTDFAHKMLDKKFTSAGTEYFTYNGEWLNDRRRRMEESGEYDN